MNPSTVSRNVQWLFQVDAKMLLAAPANRHLQTLRPRTANGFHNIQFRRDRQSAVARPLLKRQKNKGLVPEKLGKHGNMMGITPKFQWFTIILQRMFCSQGIRTGILMIEEPGGYRCPTSSAC